MKEINIEYIKRSVISQREVKREASRQEIEMMISDSSEPRVGKMPIPLNKHQKTITSGLLTTFGRIRYLLMRRSLHMLCRFDL